mmetsp:Transcript_33480/g.83963  ORF Transcript_33480/g.83963 Transcript_33480/m.83963 type:complete len:214 (-) Transcript_33480:361-1002(-)
MDGQELPLWEGDPHPPHHLHAGRGLLCGPARHPAVLPHVLLPVLDRAAVPNHLRLRALLRVRRPLLAAGLPGHPVHAASLPGLHVRRPHLFWRLGAGQCAVLHHPAGPVPLSLLLPPPLRHRHSVPPAGAGRPRPCGDGGAGAVCVAAAAQRRRRLAPGGPQGVGQLRHGRRRAPVMAPRKSVAPEHPEVAAAAGGDGQGGVHQAVSACASDQ